MFKGRWLVPIEFYEAGRKSLPALFGYEDMSMIAVAGLDVAAWDPLARAAGRAGLCAAARQPAWCGAWDHGAW